MRNDTFQNANKVFKGKLRLNKQAGHDISKPHSAIEKADLEKIYTYFSDGLAKNNFEVLQQKVFFDIQYHTGRRGKEGLRALAKDSFHLKIAADGTEYIEMSFNEVTKKNQGDESSTAYAKLHNDHPIIVEQPENYKCPVNSFKHYINNLNPNISAFFQRINKKKDGFDAMPLGKNQIGLMMRKISVSAGLSREYTAIVYGYRY